MNNIQTAIQRTLNFISSVQQHPPPGDVPTTTYLKKKKASGNLFSYAAVCRTFAKYKQPEGSHS